MLGTGKHTLVSLTVDMVKKYESEKYGIRPSERRISGDPGHYLVEHRRAVAAIVERHGGERRATLSFSRVSTCPTTCPTRSAEESAKRHAAAVREAAAPMFDSCLSEFIF